MKDKISLAGDLGSGKSTVSELLIRELGAEYYSTGKFVRSIAEKYGMTIGELNIYMETHPEIDREIDDGLVKLSEDERALIIDSRMAWHFTRGTFKVYLSTDIETSALRIMNANRQGEHNATLEETVAVTRARRESEKKRYMEQYGVDIKDMRNYSLIVDTTVATPRQVADCIISAFSAWQRDRLYKSAFLSAERINIPDSEADAESIDRYSSELECGSISPLLVIEKDGEYYLADSIEKLLAYSFSAEPFIPCMLVEGTPSGEYVRMKNSL